MGIIDRALAQSTSDFDRLSLNFLTVNSWQELVVGIVTWVLVIAAVIAFFYLIYSGFMYLTAGGNPDAAKKGQQGIMNAIIGIVIIVLSYSIIRAVVSFTGSSGGGAGASCNSAAQCRSNSCNMSVTPHVCN